MNSYYTFLCLPTVSILISRRKTGWSVKISETVKRCIRIKNIKILSIYLFLEPTDRTFLARSQLKSELSHKIHLSKNG